MEQKIKFCCKRLNHVRETFKALIQVYRDKVLSQVQDFGWHKPFLDERLSVKSKPRFSHAITLRTTHQIKKSYYI